MVRKVVDAILAKSRDVKAGKGPEKGRRIKTNRFKIHKKGVV
jgi:hypothetical protein